MTTQAATVTITYPGDGPSDLVTAAAVVGLAVILLVMVLVDAARKTAARAGR